MVLSAPGGCNKVQPAKRKQHGIHTSCCCQQTETAGCSASSSIQPPNAADRCPPSRAQMTTLSPARRNSAASARPTPLLPPVMTTLKGGTGWLEPGTATAHGRSTAAERRRAGGGRGGTRGHTPVQHPQQSAGLRYEPPHHHTPALPHLVCCGPGCCCCAPGGRRRGVAAAPPPPLVRRAPSLGRSGRGLERCGTVGGAAGATGGGVCRGSGMWVRLGRHCSAARRPPVAPRALLRRWQRAGPAACDGRGALAARGRPGAPLAKLHPPPRSGAHSEHRAASRRAQEGPDSAVRPLAQLRRPGAAPAPRSAPAAAAAAPAGVASPASPRRPAAAGHPTAREPQQRRRGAARAPGLPHRRSPAPQAPQRPRPNSSIAAGRPAR